MKRFLTALLCASFVCFSLFVLTSCGDDEETRTVTHYEITNIRSSLNLRADANMNSQTLKQLKPGERVEKLDKQFSSDGYWIQIRTSDGIRGWVKEKYVGYKTEKIVTKLTQAQKMAQANQPIASSLFGFFDKLRGYAGQFDILAYTIITAILGWGLGLWIFFCDRIRWWHYVLMVLFVATEFIAFVVCDPFAQGVKTGSFLLDLVFGLAFLGLPALQWYTTIALLGDSLSNCDYDAFDFVKLHLMISLIGLLPVGICFWLFKSAADYALFSYAGIQILFLIYAVYRSIRSGHPGAFLAYLICFALFFVPFVAMAITMAVMVMGLMVAILLFLSPFFAQSANSKTEYTLSDGYGRHVDTIDSGGSSVNSGNTYGRNIDGSWHEK